MTNRNWKSNYKSYKKALLTDKDICTKNRKLFKDFFTFEERKLKRSNGLPKLDEATYHTLHGYVMRLRNVNTWFQNKPLKDIKKKDIQRVYDDLEDGKILNRAGRPFQDRRSYYNKVFKSKLFKMVGKDELAREVIEFQIPDKNHVRFLTEEGFKELLQWVSKPRIRLLFWLAWDYGENINSNLQLKKSDFHREINPHSKEPEFRLNWRKPILKRTRLERGETNNCEETYNLLEQELALLKEDENLFTFGYAQAKKIMRRVAESARVKSSPRGEPLQWKDLRSGMTCHLLQKGWTREELNTRLGHKPSSSQIDKYITYLGIQSKQPKAKLQQFRIKEMEAQLEGVRQREKMNSKRNIEVVEDFRDLRDWVLRLTKVLAKQGVVSKDILQRAEEIIEHG